MRPRTFLVAFILVATSLALPNFAHAGIPFFGPIIPNSYNLCPGGFGMVIIVINNIISFLLTIAVVSVAPIMIAYSGFLYVVNSVNPEGISKAKGILLNTIIGIVVALAGYTIVAALMAVLTTGANGSTFAKNWSSIVTGNINNVCLKQAGALPTDTLNNAPISGLTTADASTGSDEQVIRDRFTAAGVSINKPACPSTMASSCGGAPPSCTNVAGMKEDTIRQMILIAQATGSTVNNKYVMISGGTEPGHECGSRSHQNGYKVDMSLSSNVLNNYLKKKDSGKSRGNPEPGKIYLDNCGQNQYVLASNHWDVTIFAYCPTQLQ